jgi:hypothetical protein
LLLRVLSGVGEDVDAPVARHMALLGQIIDADGAHATTSGE